MKNIVRILSLCFAALFILCSSELKAQEAIQKITVRGKVTSQTDSKPVVGAYVIERDKDMRYINGAVTDVNGNYAITVTNSQNLISRSEERRVGKEC